MGYFLGGFIDILIQDFPQLLIQVTLNYTVYIQY